MTDALRIGWTKAQSATRRSTYRRLLGFSLLLQVTIAFVALAAPMKLSQILGLPEPMPSGWMRAWGVMLLIVAVLSLPGWLDPVSARWPNIVGIVARAGTTLLYILLGGGFLWLALFDGVFLILLAACYGRLLTAELMSQP